MLMFVKQWQQPVGHEHSEQRWRQPVGRQQNHSPVVVQPTGHPPACAHGLHRKFGLVHTGCGEMQFGLHGPPPHPEQPPIEPRVTSVLVRNRPAPRELIPRNLKS